MSVHQASPVYFSFSERSESDTGSVHSHQEGEKKYKFHPGRTVFEVVSAKTMKDGHKKFVVRQCYLFLS